MKLYNLKRANDLAKELKELKDALRFLRAGGEVKIYNSDYFARIDDQGTKDKISKILLERIREIEAIVETL